MSLGAVLRAKLATAVAFACVVLAQSSDASADTARDISQRITEQWHVAGARAVQVPTRFLFDEETVLIPIPPDATEKDGDCTAVAVIGARGLSFRARLSDAPMDPLVAPEPGARASSTAGVLELRRCERGRQPIRHVVITAEAGRGSVEVIVGRSASPLPSLAVIIPERTGGAIPPPPEAGALPPLVPQEDRAKSAEARAKRDGANVRSRSSGKVGEDGAGEEEIELDEGCHRVEVFGKEMMRERPGRRFRLDVDAELRDGDHLLARDRTEAPDARLETCVGGPTRLTLLYTGAPPRTDIVVTRGSWPLPARLPPMWGPTVRSKMARVLFLRHVAVPSEDPVYLAQGSAGTTPVPLTVETGGCYVAVVGITHGQRLRQLQLRALIGARESTDERGAAEEAALSAFCVRAHESARLEVLARGTGISWGLAVFRVKSGIWEPGR